MTTTQSGADRTDAAPPSDEVDLAVSQWARERPDLDPSAMRIFGRLSRVAVLQRTVLNATHAGSGLTLGTFDVLAQLRRHGPPFRRRVTDLAHSSLLTSAGVTLRLDRMEDIGLIRRRRSDDDRRAVYAELTDVGLERIDRAIGELLAIETAMLEEFSAEERIVLEQLLRRLEQVLRERDAPP